MPDPFQVVRDFEQALCDYTGAPFCVTTTSCTMALLLATRWCIEYQVISPVEMEYKDGFTPQITIPKRTYIGVPMSIIHAGGWPVFEDLEWRGYYRLKPLPVWDAARWLFSDLYVQCGGFVCLSFHWSKTLGLGQGGAILLDDPEADEWLRMARFDGRREGVPASEDQPSVIGYHAYMSPETAAQGLVRMATLPKYNDPLPNSDYPDLSQMEIFK